MDDKLNKFFEKVPGYVRDYITMLEREIEQQRAVIRDLQNVRPKSSVSFNGGIDAPDIYLPDHGRVRFSLGERMYIDVNSIEHRHVHVVRVATDGALNVHPVAENCIDVRPA